MRLTLIFGKSAMKKILMILWLCGVLVGEVRANPYFPADNFSKGWKKAGRMLQYTSKNLYDRINGGAELFMEFGFERLLIQHYLKDSTEISAEVYQMECPAAALGIYLTKCGNETPVASIPTRNTGNRFQFTLLKGNCFIFINNFSGDNDFIPTMTTLAQQVLERIPEQPPVALFQNLPQQNLIEGSERLIRGPYALQPIFTFGSGDILQLSRKVFALVADYLTDDEKKYTFLFIPYPDKNAAVAAYQNLIQNLDPYLTIKNQSTNGFLFQDYQNKYGRVNLKENVIEIKINLEREKNLR